MMSGPIGIIGGLLITGTTKKGESGSMGKETGDCVPFGDFAFGDFDVGDFDVFEIFSAFCNLRYVTQSVLPQFQG